MGNVGPPSCLLSHSSWRKLSKVPRFRSCTDSVLIVKNLLEILATVWLMYMGLLLSPYYFESCSKIDFFFNQRRQQGSKRLSNLYSVTAQSLLFNPGLLILKSKLILPAHHSYSNRFVCGPGQFLSPDI